MTVQVPFFDARAANAGIPLDAALLRVLESHWFVLGEEVRAFEAAFAAYTSAAHCVSLANGTDAIELALRGLEVGAGDTVLLAANAGFYGSTAVLQVGAIPVYADIDPATMAMSTAHAAQIAASARPKAIIATHLYGQMADVDALAEVARQCGAALIEDCAQAHGARRAGRIAGAIGRIGCFSFYPTKNLGALGDGGAVVTSDEALAARVRALRQYGWSRKYVNTLPGGRNSRLDEMQAAVLNAKLPHLDRHNAVRRDIAKAYAQGLAGLPLQLPASLGDDYVAHLFVVRTPRRDALQAFLRERGVASDIHYPVPDHQQPVLGNTGHAALPETELACRTVLTLPCYPGMPAAQVQQVIEAVRTFFTTVQG